MGVCSNEARTSPRLAGLSEERRFQTSSFSPTSAEESTCRDAGMQGCSADSGVRGESVLEVLVQA